VTGPVRRGALYEYTLVCLSACHLRAPYPYAPMAPLLQHAAWRALAWWSWCALCVRAWTVLELAQPSDVDLVRLDLGAFNHSATLVVLADDLVWPTTAAAAVAACGDPADTGAPVRFRWTPYRVHADWVRTGALAAWRPVDPDGRRVAVGLQWFVCPDASAVAPGHARVWHTAAALGTTCTVRTGYELQPGADDPALLIARVCVPGVYALGAAPCTDGAPFGADCTECVPGHTGCACEFTGATFAHIDRDAAAVAWLVVACLTLPYLVELGALAASLRTTPGAAAGSAEDGAAASAAQLWWCHAMRVVAHLIAAALVLAQTIDTVVVRPGRGVRFAWGALACAIVFYVAAVALTLAHLCAWRSAKASRVHGARVANAALVAGVALAFYCTAVLWIMYMDPTRATLMLATGLLTVFCVAQWAHATLAFALPTRGTRAARAALALVCAGLACTYALPITLDPPCAGTTENTSL